MKAYENLLLLQVHFWFLDNEYAAGDVVPSTRRIKIQGSEFKLVVLIFQNPEKIDIWNPEKLQPLKVARSFRLLFLMLMEL